MSRSFAVAPVVILVFLVWSGFSLAQDKPIILFADYAVYKYEDGSDMSYVEIFYNLLRNNLKYHPDTSGFSAIIDFKMLISDTTGTALDSVNWKAGSRIQSLSMLDDSDYLISDICGELFRPGEYLVTLFATNGGRIGENTLRLSVPSFQGEALAVSPLEWAYSIKPGTGGKLVKNGYHVLPNASGRFQQENNMIYLYAEVYNLDLSPGADTQHTVTMDIYDSKGALYKTIDPVIYKKPGESAVIVTGFSIAAFDGGLYRMGLSVNDGSRVARMEKSFSVIPSAEKTRMKIMDSILSEYPGAKGIQNEQEAGEFRDVIAFIATTEELRLYDSLNLQGKQNFQRKFWDSRDPDPATAVNEFQLEHYRRLKYVDENFSRHAGLIPGWRSDQGRVYLLYGEPTEIERNASSIATRSWEKWWYHGMEGGVYFIFVDYDDTDSYVLIHSTKQNEIKDENWENKINMTVFQR